MKYSSVMVYYGCMRIIIVEDEKIVADSLAASLIDRGYAVDIVGDGKKAFSRISLNHTDYDLIILDLSLPNMDGKSICMALRKINITTPILVLTGQDEIQDKVDLLFAGADDYLVKPFSFDELYARIQAILRRPAVSLPAVITYWDIELNSSERVVSKNGKLIPLTLKEFVLLEYFLRNRNRVVNREELLSHLWDFNFSSFSNVIDVHVKNLRRKLDWNGDDNILETVRGVGYRLK